MKNKQPLHTSTTKPSQPTLIPSYPPLKPHHETSLLILVQLRHELLLVHVKARIRIGPAADALLAAETAVDVLKDLFVIRFAQGDIFFVGVGEVGACIDAPGAVAASHIRLVETSDVVEVPLRVSKKAGE